ncbi:hypothetical protein V3N99_01725 [Dermatophilaceae bacterium Soc4.6]
MGGGDDLGQQPHVARLATVGGDPLGDREQLSEAGDLVEGRA